MIKTCWIESTRVLDVWCLVLPATTFFPSKYLSQNAPHELHAVADYFIRKMKLIIFECCDAIEMWRISEQININHKMSRLFIQLLIWILEQFQFSADNLLCKPIGYSKKVNYFIWLMERRSTSTFDSKARGKLLKITTEVDWKWFSILWECRKSAERATREQIETDRVLK